MNLSGNIKLELGQTLEQLKESHYLEQVSFGVIEEDHKHYYLNKKYRERVLMGLLVHNAYLKFVDNVRTKYLRMIYIFYFCLFS